MIITLVILIFVIAVLALYNMHSKLNSLFIMIMLGMFIILLSLVMYITKTSYYNGIFNLEILIYKYMRKIQMNITPIKFLMTVGYTTVFLANTLIFRETSSYYSKRIKQLVTVMSFLLMLGFLFLNSSFIAEKIYIKICERNTYDYVVMLNKIFTVVNFSVVIFFLLLPIPPLVSGIKNTDLFFKKKHNLIVMIALLFLDIIIFIITFFSKIQNLMNVFMMYMFNSGSFKFDNFTALLPLSVIAVLIIVLVGSIKFDVFNTVDFFKTRVITKRMKVFLMDLKYIFHDFKNIMMTIIALKSIALEKYGTEEGKQALNKIEDTAYNYAGKIEELLNIYKAKKIVFDETDIFECIKKAVLRTEAECKAEVYIANTPEKSIINGDAYQIETLFYNILINAAESVEEKGTSDGIIKVRFIEEDNWICVEFYDNGVGMSRKERKRIWRPFLSSKNTFLNWGIGLNQAKNIIEAHLGHIDIKSKKDKFTKIQTSFPKNVQ